MGHWNILFNEGYNQIGHHLSQIQHLARHGTVEFRGSYNEVHIVDDLPIDKGNPIFVISLQRIIVWIKIMITNHSHLVESSENLG